MPSAILAADPVVSSWATKAPVLDGVLEPGEWSGATALAASGDCEAGLFVANDERTMYVAFEVLGGDPGIVNEWGLFEFEDQVGSPPVLSSGTWDTLACGGDPQVGEGRIDFFQSSRRGTFTEFTSSGECSPVPDAAGSWSASAARDEAGVVFEMAVPLDGGSALEAQPGQQFGLGVAVFKPGCNAPRFPAGYNPHSALPSLAPYQLSNFGCTAAVEAFGSTLPLGWRVSTPTGSGIAWTATSGAGTPQTCGMNVTGGTGSAACAAAGPTFNAFETLWTSPPFSLTSAETARLHFVAVFTSLLESTEFDVELSDDDGQSWQSALHWSTSQGSFGSGIDVDVDLASWAGAADPIRVRFVLHDTAGLGVDYVQLDDLALVCGPAIFDDGFESGLTTHWSADSI